MKKLLLAAFAMVSMSLYSQEKGNFYASTGLSVTNSNDFKNSSFYSVEGGYTKNNFSYGVVLGTNDLNFDKFWYEGKIAYTLNFNQVDPYVLLGVGSYFDNYNLFLEYGFGVSKSFGPVSPYLQFSNWNTKNYITAGLTFNFK
jgi:hypothetical protein